MFWKIRLGQSCIEKKLLKNLQNKKVTLKNKKNPLISKIPSVEMNTLTAKKWVAPSADTNENP